MKLNDFPALKTDLEDVLRMYPLVWQGFDEATAVAGVEIDALTQRYRPKESGPGDDRRLPPEPHFFPHFVRYVVKLFLGQRGIDAELEMDDVPNSGLRLRYNGRIIRVRKATRSDGIPNPGESKTWQAVYQYVLGEEYSLAGTDLYLLWHASPIGTFRGLSIVCGLPRKGSRTRTLGVIELPAPSMLRVTPEVAWPAAQADEWETLGDLAIEPLGEEEEIEQNNDQRDAGAAGA